MRTKFLWVLYFRQVGDLPDIFQNHTSRIIFSKLTLNLVKIWRNLRNKMRFDFFVPINFKRGFLSQKWTGTSFDKEYGAFSFAFCVELDYRCWRKCFISQTSPIELNTKNKLTAPPQFRFYPPGSKSVALQLGVHLILLYFIRISLLSAETFF